MADITTLRSRLVEAESAYHRLMTGDREVEVQFSDGRRMRYSETTARDLKRYVDELRAEIVHQISSVPAAGPVGFLF
jgi:hypothetical protein